MALIEAEAEPRREPSSPSLDELARAVMQLAERSACCSEVASASPAPSVAVDEKPRAPRRRGRHRTRPVSRRFVLPAVTVLEPGVGRQVADVLVGDGKVADVVPPRDGEYEGYERLEIYRGSFVMPALTDMHTHVAPHNALGLVDLWMLLYYAHGITTIRDAGDTDGTSFDESRDGLASGRLIGPRIFAAGPFVNKRTSRPRWSNNLFLDGPDDAVAIARTLVQRGHRCMKIYEDLTVEDIAALERAAAEHGLVTLGHVPTQLAYEDARLADAQHFFGVPPPASLPRNHVLDRTMCWEAVDDKRMDVIVRAAVAGRLANTPTLVATERLVAAGPTGRLDDPSLKLLPRIFSDVIWSPRWGLPAYRHPDAKRIDRLQAALDKKLALVGRLYRAGATVRIGTDFQSFAVPGWALHAEMRLFERAGIPTETVLKMVTRDAALALGQTDVGVIRKNAIADLLVCRDDPSRDLGALSTIRAVAHAGALYSSEHLWSEIKDNVEAHDRLFARVGANLLARLGMWRIARRFVG